MANRSPVAERGEFNRPKLPHDRVFGLADWEAWLDRMARAMFGMPGPAFEIAYRRGELTSGSARDLGSILPLLDALREQNGRKPS